MALHKKTLPFQETIETLPPPLSLPLDGLSSWKTLKQYLGFGRSAARKRELEGRFPKRIRLSERCTVWPNRELHRYFEDPVNYRAKEGKTST